MKLIVASVIAIASGCGGGGGGGGDPQTGDAAVVVGSDSEPLATGAAILDPDTSGNMRVQLGVDHVDCNTSLELNSLASIPPSGDYVYFGTDMSNPVTDVAVDAVFARVSAGNNIEVDETTGSATITAIGAQVDGMLVFETTDDTLGTITTTGSFSVTKCF